MTSKALLSMLEVDPALSGHPLAKLILEHPEEARRVLPVLIRSNNEYHRLMRMYPGAARELRLLALEMGKASRGDYIGQL